LPQQLQFLFCKNGETKNYHQIGNHRIKNSQTKERLRKEMKERKMMKMIKQMDRTLAEIKEDG